MRIVWAYLKPFRGWLGGAVTVGLAGRIFQALTDYVTRLVVRKFGLAVFDELMRKKPEYRPEEPIEIGEIDRLRFDRVSFRYQNGTQDAVVNQ